MNASAPSQVIIDLAAYRHNLDVVRRFIGDEAAITAVVKADAYGHGALPIAREALQWGVRMVGVATAEEGVALREGGIDGPILVLIQPDPDRLPLVLEYDLTPMISDVRTAELLGELAHAAKKVVAAHCKIDTGMGRQGFSLNHAADELQYITRISHIDIEGVATHFPVADQSEDPFTYNQIKAFRQLLKHLDRLGIPYDLAHAANSPAIVNYHGSAFDMVRPGLMTYGVWPVQQPVSQAILHPVLRWETRVVQVRELEPGASIGYGRTYSTPVRMKAAVLPVGYADGYKHALSNRSDVLIQGVRCPVRGSVSMDQIVVDVTALPHVEIGDTGVLIGRDGEERVTVEELAELAGAIPYDILTGIGARVQRHYRNAQAQ